MIYDPCNYDLIKNKKKKYLISKSQFYPLRNRKWFLNKSNESGKLFTFDDINKITYHIRHFYVEKFSYCIHTQESINALCNIIDCLKNADEKILDVGCGTGYLTTLLENKGYDIKGIDNYSHEYYFDKTLINGSKTFINENCIEYIKKHKSDYKIFIMSWICYDSNHGYEFIKELPKGSILIYQGEFYGGCCANDQFFEYLNFNFDELEYLSEKINSVHLQFEGIHDQWGIYVKSTDS